MVCLSAACRVRDCEKSLGVVVRSLVCALYRNTQDGVCAVLNVVLVAKSTGHTGVTHLQTGVDMDHPVLLGRPPETLGEWRFFTQWKAEFNHLILCK